MSSGTWNLTFKISTGELAGLKDYHQIIPPTGESCKKMTPKYRRWSLVVGSQCSDKACREMLLPLI